MRFSNQGKDDPYSDILEIILQTLSSSVSSRILHTALRDLVTLYEIF
jgi:hypothetical protein